MAANVKRVGYSESGNSKLSLKQLAILYLPNLVYATEDIVVLNFEGYNVIVEEAKEFGEQFVCVVTFMYQVSGKMQRKQYYMRTICQLNKWLECMRKHSRMMFLLGYCENIEKVPNGLKTEPLYLITRLNEIAENPKG